MKWIFIILLALLQFVSYSQNGRDTIISKTDKKIYLSGETIKTELKSRKNFCLMTNGDCQGTIFPAFYVMEIDGAWKEPGMQRQMCCGLPFTLGMKQKEYETVIDEVGRYKVFVLTDKGLVVSNIFEVVSPDSD